MAAGLCREQEGAPVRRHAGQHRQRRRGRGAGPRGLPRQVADQAQLAFEREHAVHEPCGGVRRARLARDRALRRKRPSHWRSLLRVDLQDEPARGIGREVPRMVRDAGRREDLVPRRPHREGNQPRPAAHHPDRIRARRGRQPRDRRVHRPAPAKPAVMMKNRKTATPAAETGDPSALDQDRAERRPAGYEDEVRHYLRTRPRFGARRFDPVAVMGGPRTGRSSRQSTWSPLRQVLTRPGHRAHRVVQVDSATLKLRARRTGEAPQVQAAALPMGGAKRPGTLITRTSDDPVLPPPSGEDRLMPPHRWVRGLRFHVWRCERCGARVIAPTAPTPSRRDHCPGRPEAGRRPRVNAPANRPGITARDGGRRRD